MFNIYNGMTLLISQALRQGAITNVIDREGVEKQVYDHRFGLFQKVPFPQYIPYEQYKANQEHELRLDQAQLLSLAKDSFIEGKKIL